MILKCFILDDEPMARKGIKEYIDDTEFLEYAGEGGNPIDAMDAIEALQPDLLFLDIQMPHLTGMDYLKHFRPRCTVILTTAYPEFAVASYELDVADYLLKPIPYVRFLKAVQKVRKIQEQPATDKRNNLFVKADGKLVRVVLDELEYVEALQNYILLYTAKGRLTVHLTLKGLLEQLPANQFMQVHKSYIVNLQQVDSLEGSTLWLGEAQIPISRALKNEVRERLMG